VQKINFGLLGAGGFAREVMPYVKVSVGKSLRVAIEDINVYFVETWTPSTSTVNGYPVISLMEFLGLAGKSYFNIAIGDAKFRSELVQKIGNSSSSLSIFSPNFIALENNAIGEGAIFCANSMVTSNATIGRFFHANIYSYVAHDCLIGDFVTFAPGVRCNGRVRIDDYAYIGTNAVIREGSPDKPLHIGKGAIVGMGAIVTKDVPEGVTVIGNPARPLFK